jgi:hypothetical protein
MARGAEDVAHGYKTIDYVCLQPVERLCQLAGAGGHITISIFDSSNVRSVSQAVRVTDEMLKVHIYVICGCVLTNSCQHS